MNPTSKPPTKSKLPLLRQICNLIPGHLVGKLARETGVEDKARTFTPWSHLVSLMFAQLAHSFGLNDVCDALQMQGGLLQTVRGATAPSRNGLSHANKERSAEMAEKLFWKTLEHLSQQEPAFGRGRTWGKAHRFRRTIHVIDATVIELVANCMDWAKHRRRKAAAKTHLRLDLQSLLPRFVIVDTAAEHDNRRARELCAGVKEGEIVIFDKGYIDYEHLADMDQRGVYWVTRAKENMVYQVKERLPVKKGSKIISDELVHLTEPAGKALEVARRVTALVEVDGKEREMVFLTNNFSWSPQSVVDLYGCRWEIEGFFKQIKQTLQLSDFLGHSANAVKWQVWTALLVYLLMRYLSFLSKWPHSFTRLFTVLRAGLWLKFDLINLLQCYGTAGGPFRYRAQPEQAYFAGFS